MFDQLKIVRGEMRVRLYNSAGVRIHGTIVCLDRAVMCVCCLLFISVITMHISDTFYFIALSGV